MKIVPIPARDPNSKPNPRFVKSLKIGVDRLWNGRKGKNSDGSYAFICNSLGGLATTRQQLRKLIEKRMGGYATFGGWAEQYGKFTEKQIQKGRKAWMLDLIEEFS